MSSALTTGSSATYVGLSSKQKIIRIVMPVLIGPNETVMCTNCALAMQESGAGRARTDDDRIMSSRRQYHYGAL